MALKLVIFIKFALTGNLHGSIWDPKLRLSLLIKKKDQIDKTSK
jgi:hypothetical protein